MEKTEFLGTAYQILTKAVKLANKQQFTGNREKVRTRYYRIEKIAKRLIAKLAPVSHFWVRISFRNTHHVASWVAEGAMSIPEEYQDFGKEPFLKVPLT